MVKPKKKIPCPASVAFEAFSKAFQELDTPRTERIKCWEFMKCGDECMKNCAAFEKSAGRRCWLVAGTLSGMKPTCVHCRTLSSCKECEFYQKIKRGEI